MESAAIHHEAPKHIHPVKEPNDYDDDKKATPAAIDKHDEADDIAIGGRGFLAITANGRVVAKDRKELRKRIASLMENEAYAAGSEPIEIYRVTRLPLAKQVGFKF